MSLLSPDTLSLYIAPDRVQAVKAVGWGQRPAEVRQREARVQEADDWKGLVDVVGAMVQQTQTRRLHIVLSDTLARYAAFPWRAELRNAAEDLTMARLNFDDVYGAGASAAWHFGFSAARPGQSRLSIAIPLTLYNLLQANLGDPRLRVASVRTAFSATLQAHSRQLGDNGWLINLEDGRLTLGSWKDNGWSWIYSLHALINTPEALLMRVRQELQLASVSLKPEQPLPIYLHAPAFEHLPFGSMEGAHFLPLKTTDRQAGPKYAFALLGVHA